jgi:NTP pyrophosphatase (non-canonical NTP hydrolase)
MTTAREIAEAIADEDLLSDDLALAIESALLAERRRAIEARDDRQLAVHDWCIAAFGKDHAASLPQRGVRLLEEAIELYQAAGCDEAMAHKLVSFVFARPPGTIAQELGGVGLTVLALAAAAGISADGEEKREFDRVSAKPLSHFHARNAAKNAAGFDVTGGDYPVSRSLASPREENHEPGTPAG